MALQPHGLHGNHSLLSLVEPLQSAQGQRGPGGMLGPRETQLGALVCAAQNLVPPGDAALLLSPPPSANV